MKLFYLDVETTGIDPKQNGIIQIAGIVEIDGSEVETFDFQVAPFQLDLIEASALEVNKTTKEQIAAYPNPREVYAAVTGILSRYVDKFNRSDKFGIIGYNAAFDTQFLREWFAKNGDKYYGSWFWHPYIDVMTLAMVCLIEQRANLADFKLGTVAAHLGIEIDKDALHDGLYDVRLAKKLFAIVTETMKSK